ncbi:MAG: hypothetical protein ACRDR6_11020 [Pseudonocardiaceae bacterium]
MTEGTYLSVLIDPKIRGARRRAAILAAARDGADLDEESAHLVRVIEYDVPDREGNGTGELIVPLSTITDPTAARADELAGHRPRPDLLHPRPAPHPPHRHRYGGFSP